MNGNIPTGPAAFGAAARRSISTRRKIPLQKTRFFSIGDLTKKRGLVNMIYMIEMLVEKVMITPKSVVSGLTMAGKANPTPHFVLKTPLFANFFPPTCRNGGFSPCAGINAHQSGADFPPQNRKRRVHIGGFPASKRAAAVRRVYR
jgi:hypothetical protein